MPNSLMTNQAMIAVARRLRHQVSTSLTAAQHSSQRISFQACKATSLRPVIV